jgi:hypothetical protein
LYCEEVAGWSEVFLYHRKGEIEYKYKMPNNASLEGCCVP